MFKRLYGDINCVDYDDLDNYDYNYDFSDDDEYRKIGSIRTLFGEFPIAVLQEEMTTTWNILVKEIDMKMYHLKNILISLNHV